LDDIKIIYELVLKKPPEDFCEEEGKVPIQLSPIYELTIKIQKTDDEVFNDMFLSENRIFSATNGETRIIDAFGCDKGDDPDNPEKGEFEKSENPNIQVVQSCKCPLEFVNEICNCELINKLTEDELNGQILTQDQFSELVFGADGKIDLIPCIE